MKGNLASRLKVWQNECLKGGECGMCKRTLDYLTVDHIVPISFVLSLDNGKNLAINDEDNFQKLCQPCNKMKGSSWDLRDLRTIKLLKKYLQPYEK